VWPPGCGGNAIGRLPGGAGTAPLRKSWRSRVQVLLMKFHASAGRETCGVVRTLTPVPRDSSMPCGDQRVGGRQRQQEQVAVRPRAGDHVLRAAA
jgi:hypothetical protein